MHEPYVGFINAFHLYFILQTNKKLLRTKKNSLKIQDHNLCKHKPTSARKKCKQLVYTCHCNQYAQNSLNVFKIRNKFVFRTVSYIHKML